MKSKNRFQLHLQLILPVLAAFVLFGFIVHSFWAPELVRQEKEKVIEREHDVLRNLSLALKKDLIASDYGSIYETLEQMEVINKDEKLTAELYDAQDNQLYPLGSLAATSEYHDRVTIISPIISDNDILGTLKITIDAQQELVEIIEHVNSLESIMIVIAAGILLLLLALHYLAIGRPILQLINVAQRIGAGNLSTPIPKNLSSVTGGLGNAFTKMQQELRNSRARLENALQDAHDNSTRYRTVLESIPGALLVLDERGFIDDLNLATEDIFGYQRDEVLCQNSIKLFQDSQSDKDLDSFFKTASNETQEIQKYGKRKDGSLIPLRLYLRTMPLKGQTKLIVIATDISQIVQTQEELLHAISEAEQAIRAKSEFLSRMSHEFRTPLNAILGFGQLLQYEEGISQIQKDNISEILHSGNHLLQLVNEALYLSSIEDHQLKLTLEPLDLNTFVGDAISQYQPQSLERSISINAEGMTGLPAIIADKDGLSRLLNNLIDNAIKYNFKGGSIKIKAAHISDNNTIRVSVIDTGHGISSENLPRLFRPFERLESPYEGTDGTGIGLALCKQLAENMEGSIGVESKPGVGSTFWFELPIALTAETSKETSKDTSTHSRIKILYVEDNPANTRLLMKIASLRKGVEMLHASNAEKGLEIARKEIPTLILMDLNLPGMNGFEALQQLRKIPETKDIPVIAVTAQAMPDDIARIKANKFDNYIIKPLEISRFNEVIDMYTETKI